MQVSGEYNLRRMVWYLLIFETWLFGRMQRSGNTDWRWSFLYTENCGACGSGQWCWFYFLLLAVKAVIVRVGEEAYLPTCSCANFLLGVNFVGVTLHCRLSGCYRWWLLLSRDHHTLFVPDR